jgi:ribonuclease HI
MELVVYTDGGAINNPGPAAYAFILSIDNKIYFSSSRFIGNNTNNFAEYSGLVSALEWIKENTELPTLIDGRCAAVPVRFLRNNKERVQISKIVCRSDSELMVNQINGNYKVKNANIRDFIMKIRILEQEIQTPIIYTYIPREKNEQADALVKKELKNAAR